MPATIIGLSSGQGLVSGQVPYKFEPETVYSQSADGIGAFSFSIIGKYSDIAEEYQQDSFVNGAPNQPNGIFKVVQRNLEHIAGGQDGIYRLSVSSAGGIQNELYISEASYAFASRQVSGVITTELQQTKVIYNLEWLYPSVTVTGNNSQPSTNNVDQIAKSIISGLVVEKVKDKPAGVGGPSINASIVKKTGSSIERIGGLYRVRCTFSKGDTTV